MVPDHILPSAARAPGSVLLHDVSAVSAQNDFQHNLPPEENHITNSEGRLNRLTREVKLNFLNIRAFLPLNSALLLPLDRRVKSWGKPQFAKHAYPGESGAGIP